MQDGKLGSRVAKMATFSVVRRCSTPFARACQIIPREWPILKEAYCPRTHTQIDRAVPKKCRRNGERFNAAAVAHSLIGLGR